MEAKTHVSGNVKVNLFGLVLGFSPPKLTKRNDWMMTVALVDETTPLCDPCDVTTAGDTVKSININMFARKLENLPDLLYAGDVLRLHRVELKEWNDELQLLGITASSYVVGRDESSFGNGGAWTILPTAKMEFSLSDEDERRMRDLWQWGQGRLRTFPSMKSEQSFKLCDMQRQDHSHFEYYGDDSTRGDLTVMVAAIIPVPDGERSRVSARGFLRVWDGTGFPSSDPLPLATAQASDSVKFGDPPPDALLAISNVIDKLHLMGLKRELQAPLAVTGRVANVTIWEQSHWNIVSRALKVGSFIRLRNVQDTRMVDSGLRCLAVYAKSGLTPLPQITYEVISILEAHQIRLQRREPLNPQSGVLTLKSARNTYVSTNDFSIVDPIQMIEFSSQNKPSLESFAALQVPSAFSGLVKIVATIPPIHVLLQSPVFLGQGCESKSMHRFGLRVSDQTREMDVIVPDFVAQRLLQLPEGASNPNKAKVIRDLKRSIEKNASCKVELSSFMDNGEKFLVLKKLELES
jgi:hypothetical protein